MDRIFQVSEFNEFINVYLKQTGELVVEGEISEINVSQGKWLFITIKDSASNLSVFAPVYNISGWQGLSEGMKVQVTGTPGLFSKSGKFSFTATKIIPSGEGALKLAFEKLKLQLEKEGLFSESRKRKIPRFPIRVGLITAKNSEAYNDFVKVSSERLGGIQIYLYSVSVQGRDAVDSIKSALNYFNTHLELQLDCLVLTRGGGSLEDLQAFNDESIARLVYSSNIPVISAVGHERDVTLIDYVSDLRASTPSNAAEIIFPHRQNLLSDVNYYQNLINKSMNNLIDSKKIKLHRLVQLLDKHSIEPLNSFKQLFFRLNNIPRNLLLENQNQKVKVNLIEQRLSLSMNNFINNQKLRVESLNRMLVSYDHEKVLMRGYSITTLPDGSIIKSVSQLKPSIQITTTLLDGKINSTVN